jgi:hypothetical protein
MQEYETGNFDLLKFGHFCNRRPLLMFTPDDGGLATPLIMTSCFQVDLYGRFGVTYVSSV